MKKLLICVLALVAMGSVSYWAFERLRPHTYSGEMLTFEVGSGSLAVTNLGNEPVVAEMRAAGETAFRVRIPSLSLRKSSTPVGSDGDLYHALTVELPQGRTNIQVIGNSAVMFVSLSSTPLRATVTPLGTMGVQLTVLLTGAVILTSLYFLSSAMQHRWLEILREKSAGSLSSSLSGSAAFMNESILDANPQKPQPE